MQLLYRKTDLKHLPDFLYFLYYQYFEPGRFEILKTGLDTLLPLIFGPFEFSAGVAENKRGRKSLAFFRVAENFPKHLYNSKQKRKKNYL